MYSTTIKNQFFTHFDALGYTKQKKPTQLDRGPPLHVNRVLLLDYSLVPWAPPIFKRKTLEARFRHMVFWRKLRRTSRGVFERRTQPALHLGSSFTQIFGRIVSL